MSKKRLLSSTAPMSTHQPTITFPPKSYYVRRLRSDEYVAMQENGTYRYVVFSADGEPIAFFPTLASAFATSKQHGAQLYFAH
jgi:hypothetical protein